MDNIYLIGMMGSGKSTIGKKLAIKLNMTHVDLDDDIEAINEMTIAEIFNNSGEQKFRDMEFAYFAEKSKQKNNIFSTGGGIILQKENRLILKNTGITFFLEADCQILLDRIKNIKKRPLLNEENPLNNILSVWDKRKKYYHEASHHTINTSILSVNDVIKKILKKLNNATNLSI